MFPVNYPKFLDKNLPLIDGEMSVLLFDKLPILFTGKNKYENYIIGSSVDEDYENDFERYFHIIVTRSDFRDYYKRKISYLDLLKNSSVIYVIDKYAETDKQVIGTLLFSEIPKEYRPTSQTYFPESAYEPSYEYVTKIEGGIANDNLAVAEDVSILQNSTVAFFDKALHTIRKTLGFEMKTRLKPATVGSYSVNYVVKLTNYPEIYVSTAQLFGFLNDFSKYCIEYLPNEVEKVLSLEDEVLSNSEFEKLFVKVLNLVPMSNFDNDEEKKMEIKTSLRNDVLATPKILMPIAEVAKNYGTIEFDNFDFPIATIESNFSETLKIVLDKVDVVIIEDKVKPFEMSVYSFNKRSGRGRAELLVEKQKIAITFLVPKGQSKEKGRTYLESMFENRYIPVSGQMTYKSGTPYHLDIEE